MTYYLILSDRTSEMLTLDDYWSNLEVLSIIYEGYFEIAPFAYDFFKGEPYFFAIALLNDA